MPQSTILGRPTLTIAERMKSATMPASKLTDVRLASLCGLRKRGTIGETEGPKKVDTSVTTGSTGPQQQAGRDATCD